MGVRSGACVDCVAYIGVYSPLFYFYPAGLCPDIDPCHYFIGWWHYTYAEVPWFNWLRDTFELSRNYYDRVGHFAQGFVPAMIVREILLRKSPLEVGRWLFFIVCCICLSISAFYEFIEWWGAVYEGGAADAFLGTQGDVWDTQWDMLMALAGAISAQTFLARLHDRQMMNVSR